MFHASSETRKSRGELYLCEQSQVTLNVHVKSEKSREKEQKGVAED